MKISTWYPMCESHGKARMKEGDMLLPAVSDEDDVCAVPDCGAKATHEYWPVEEEATAVITPEQQAKIEEAIAKLHFRGDDSGITEVGKILTEVGKKSKQ